MPSNKDTKKKLPEILDKFASNSEKATKQLGEMSSQLSAFVDMLSENIQKESRRKDTEDRRREKARAVRAERDAERDIERAENKAEREAEKKKKTDAAAANKAEREAEKKKKDDAAAKREAEREAEKKKKTDDAAAAELQKTQNEYAEAAKGLAQLDKDELKKAKQKAKQKESDKLKEQQKERQEKIGKLKEKGTPILDIANNNFSSGNILGGLFASIFAIKDVSNKRKLSSLEKDEKEYNEQEEDRNNQEKEDQEKETESDLKQKRLEAKKKLQESVTKLQGSVQPAASVSPSKIANPEDQVIAETVKLNDEDKVKQTQEQTKQLGTLDDNISRIWTDHLQVTVADISDPAIDKLKKAIGGGAPAAAAAGSLGALGNLGIAAAMAAILPEILTAGAIALVLTAVWLGLEKSGYLGKMQNYVMDSAENAKEVIKETVDGAKNLLGIPKEIQRPLNESIRSAVSGVYNGDEQATNALEQLVVSESAGNPSIIAHHKQGAGAAAGLFQFIPSTAIAMATQYKKNNPSDTTFDKLIASKGTPEDTTNIVAGLSVENQVKLQKEYVKPLISRVQKAAGNTTALPNYAQMKSFQFAAGFDPGDPNKVLFDANSPGSGKLAIDQNRELKEIANKNNGVVTSKTLQQYFENTEHQPNISKFRDVDNPKRLTKTQLQEISADGKGKYNIGIEDQVLDLPSTSPENANVTKYKQYNLFGESRLTDLKSQADKLNQADPDNLDKLKTIYDEIKTIQNIIIYNNSVIKKLESTPQASAVPPQTAVNVAAVMKNKAETDKGNTVNIAQSNTVVGGAKSGDGLAYLDSRDGIRKAFNQDIFGIVARSSAFG